MKPSQRKSLAGLDNTTADGLNGFSILADIVKKYFAGNKGIVSNLERGKRYLKIGYPQHCIDHSSCASHCISFALSDTTDPNLCKERQCGFENHDSFCDQCSNLYSTIDQIIDLVKESQLKNKDDLLYDTSNAKNNILKWTFHIICHFLQNKAKTNVFDLLSETTGLWIRDYCQKVLPMEFRESQSSYFGKKGVTLHCDVFLLQKNGTVKKHTYFTTAYRSNQDIKDSLSLGDCVVKEFSKDCIVKATMPAAIMEIPILSQFIKFVNKIPLH